MPPRPSSLCWSCRTAISPSRLLTPFSFGQQQARAASILSSLSDVRAAYNKKIRRGRGPASGKGKTSGRGHKGQKQHGKVPRGFNGGQTTEEVYKGARGFKNVFATELSKLNLDTLQSWIDQGRIDPKKPITLLELATSRCIHGVKKDGVKLLARNQDQFRTPVNIVVSRASAAAIQAVESVGGTITTRFYTPFAIHRIMKGLTNPLQGLRIAGSEEDATTSTSKFKYRLPDPTGRKDIEYYRDPAHRGYLSHTVKEGETPSLFFKNPGIIKARTVGAGPRKKAAAANENAVW